MNNKSVNIILLVISQAINVVILFIFTPYLVRALPKQIYGSYSQVLFITEFFSIATTFAILQIAMMFFTNTQKNINNSFKTIITFTIVAGIIGMILSFIFSFIAPGLFDNPMLGNLLKIFSISLLGSKLNMVLNQALIRIEKTKFILFLSVLSNLIKLILAVYVIKKYESIELMLLIYALEPIICSLIQLALLYKNGYLKGVFDSTIFKEIIKIGLPLYFVEILGSSYTYIAGFIISINLNEEQYAIYRNGSVELPVIGTIYGTISLIFMGDMLNYIQDNNFKQVAATKKKIISTTVIILFPIAIFFIYFSKEFIVLYMSEKYLDSYIVFMIFSAALLIRFQNYTDILILMKKSKYVLISFFTFIFFNIILNLVLSKFFGIFGCAFATIFSVYILAFMQLHITIKKLNVSYSDYIDFKLIFKVLVASLTLIGLFKITYVYFKINFLLSFISAGAISIPLLILFFLKNKYVELTPFENILKKVPFIGNKILSFLK